MYATYLATEHVELYLPFDKVPASLWEVQSKVMTQKDCVTSNHGEVFLDRTSLSEIRSTATIKLKVEVEQKDRLHISMAPAHT
jgi:hypothetical protein